MTKDKALEMALILIEQLNMDGWVLADFEPQMYACIAAIKKTLSQPVKGSCAECGVGGGYALYCVACAEKFVVQTETKDEFVAWEQFYPDIGKPQIAFNAEVVGYVAPQRTWVGLTDDEVYKIAFALEGEHWRKIADAIEAKLKEKNVT